jgi:hypothetical protein
MPAATIPVYSFPLATPLTHPVGEQVVLNTMISVGAEVTV